MTSRNTILAILAEEAGAEAVLRHAACADAALPDGFVTALHVRVDPISTIMPTEEVLSDEQARAIEREGTREGAALLAVFEGWRAQAGVPAEWKDVVGTVDGQVRDHAKDAALLVTVNAGPDARGHGRTALHTALFDTGRPVLAIPAGHAARAIRRIVVGWKDSAASCSAVQAALPWLQNAEDVQVVHVGDDAGALAAAEQLLSSLGVKATLQAVPENGLADGERLLAEVTRVGADWLVMGAYRRRRIVEWMLGGVTRTVLGKSTIPLLLVH